MTVSSLDLFRFRNIREQHIEFSPGVTLLTGDNAQGKTNALEAVYYFAAGKSFRGVRDREAVMKEEESSRLTLQFTEEAGGEERERKLELGLFTSKRKEMKRGGVTIPQASDFVGCFRAVLFCPEHLQLVKGGPQGRRAFLDTAICQLKPAYLSALSVYAKLLKQKNALLKNDVMDLRQKKELLEVLNEQIAGPDAYITAVRRDYVKKISEKAAKVIEEMTGGKERLSIAYISDIFEEEEADEEELRRRYREKQKKREERELYAGLTLGGCHRDDIAITLDGEEAKTYASQGQDRSIALAMKLAEGETAKEKSGEAPVFLFDDVLSELDRSRQEYLMERTQGKQVILTSCGGENIGDAASVRKIRVREGTFEEID